MPSLLGTTVAANYGKMTPQQTYGVGTIYSNFGTRQLRFVQISAVTGNTGSTSAIDFSSNYQSPLSAFAVAVRALQTAGEVYYINIPNATGFVVAVAEDTLNDSDTNTNVPGGYGDIEATVLAALVDGGFATGTGKAVTGSLFTVAAA